MSDLVINSLAALTAAAEGLLRGEDSALRAAIRAGGDPLGEAFCRLRPGPERRAAGAFYTPPAIVAAMVDWALAHQPDRVVDPGCGSARFLLAVARAAPAVELIGDELDPLPALLARANLAALDARHATILEGDYLTAAPPGTAGRTAFLGNPPYVRHHDLSPAQKAWGKAAAAELGVPWSSLAGLHVHFLLATARLARPGDVVCFITSGEWLDTQYGATVRRLLLDRLGLRCLTRVDPGAATFDDAMTTGLILGGVVGPAPARVWLREVTGAADLAPLEAGREVAVADLQTATRWSPLFRERVRPRPDTVALGELVRVSRGAATGANAFFLLPPEEVAARALTPWCRPALSGAEQVFASPGVVRAEPAHRWLLDPPRETDLASPAAAPLAAWLAAGEARGVAERYLCRHRRPWWHLGAPAPLIVATYMARQPPAFALNPDGLAIVNVLHGLHPRQAWDAEELAALVAWLNAHRAELVMAARVYRGGLWKFEPREMEALRVPAALAPAGPG